MVTLRTETRARRSQLRDLKQRLESGDISSRRFNELKREQGLVSDFEFRRARERQHQIRARAERLATQPSDVEVRREASVQQGFVSIDPRVQATTTIPPITPKSDVAVEQIRLRQALPISTVQARHIPLTQRVEVIRQDELPSVRKIDRRDPDISRPMVRVKETKKSPAAEVFTGAKEIGKEFIISPIKGTGKVFLEVQRQIAIGKGLDIEKAPKIIPRKPLTFDPDVQAAAFVGGLSIVAPVVPLVPKVLGKVIVGAEAFKFVKKPTPKQAGRFLTTGALIAGPALIGKVKRFTGRTDIKLEAFPTEKKITFIGEGFVKGEPAKAVLVSRAEGSKLFLRTKGGLAVSETQGNLITGKVTSSLIERKVIAEARLGLTTKGVTSELLRTDVIVDEPGIKLDLKLSDIARRRIAVTPEITKVTEIRPTGKRITALEFQDPIIEFGKGKKQPQFLSIEKIPGGQRVTQVKAPEISEITLFRRRGTGKLRLTEPSQFELEISKLTRSKLARSRKAQASLILERQKPVVKIEPTRFRSFEGLSVPEISKVSRLPRLGVFPAVGLGRGVSQIPVQGLRTRLGFKPIQTPFPRQIPRSGVTPRSAIGPGLDIGPRQRIAPSVRSILDIKPVQPIKPFPTPRAPLYKPPKTPRALPPTPFMFDLKPPRLIQEEDKRRTKLFQQRRGFTPSLVGIAFGIKAPKGFDPKRTFTGLEVRPLI